jgi:hypothetical protein
VLDYLLSEFVYVCILFISGGGAIHYVILRASEKRTEFLFTAKAYAAVWTILACFFIEELPILRCAFAMGYKLLPFRANVNIIFFVIGEIVYRISAIFFSRL